MELTREELNIINLAFEDLNDICGLKEEELDLWDRIKEELRTREVL